MSTPASGWSHPMRVPWDAELLSLEDCPVGELLDWDTAPLMFSFCDPDGNRMYVAEPS